MTGSIKRDEKRGTWSFVVDVTSPTGERSQLRRRGFATKKATSSAMSTIVAEQARGAFVRPTRATLAQFLTDEWLPGKRRGLRPATINAYLRMVELYVRPTIGAAQLAAVDGSMLNGLYAWLLTQGRTDGRTGVGTGLSPKTVRNIHGMLSKAFRD